MSSRRYALAGIGLLAVLVVGSFVMPAAWGGADGQAEEGINQISPGYEPWFNPVWTPPSGEIESLLFSLQAAVGGLAIGYYLGRFRSSETETDPSSADTDASQT
ncbi:MAG: energy-coupling factor ABC transporter substrate-binding protein [Halobacteria archaeon]|nr:energy-coupling factor ABC transporter substrate-binding protein [Halobacteria archaeon]